MITYLLWMGDLGRTDLVQHDIDSGSHTTIQQRVFNMLELAHAYSSHGSSQNLGDKGLSNKII